MCVNEEDYAGGTPLMYSIQRGNLPVALELLSIPEISLNVCLKLFVNKKADYYVTIAQ